MSSPPGYEFDDKQNAVIEQLARSMLWIAAPLQVVGILYGVGCVLAVIQAFRETSSALGAVYAFLGAIFFLGLGTWTRNAAQSFHQITTTTGKDIDHLMDGLDNLRKMYSLLSTIVKVYVALMVIALVVALILTIAAAFRG
jgi:hypothetical protein